MADTRTSADGEEHWLVLTDPSWHSDTPDEIPPDQAIVGGWALDDDGAPGLFQPNQEYVPLDESTPSDPLDAVLRLSEFDESICNEIVPTFRNAVVELGCDEDGSPLAGHAPDGTPCVMVVSAAIHKRYIELPSWRPVPGDAFPGIIPPNLEIFINPGSDHQFLLFTATLRDRCDLTLPCG